MAKKEKNKRTTKGKEVMKNLDKENNVSIKKAITMLFIVIFIVALVYFIAAFIMGEISFKDTKEKATIQYETILAGSTFKQHDNEYIVVYYDFEGNDKTAIETAISTYKSAESAKAVYKADLSLKQNKVYQTEDNSNKKPTSAKELKVKGTTLIHMKAGKVKAYIEGKNKIEDYLK